MAGKTGAEIVSKPSGQAPAATQMATGGGGFTARRIAVAREKRVAAYCTRKEETVLAKRNLALGLAAKYSRGWYQGIITDTCLDGLRLMQAEHPDFAVREEARLALSEKLAGPAPDRLSDELLISGLWRLERAANHLLLESAESILSDGDFVEAEGILHYLMTKVGFRQQATPDRPEKITVAPSLLAAIGTAKTRLQRAAAETQQDFVKKAARFEEVASPYAYKYGEMVEQFLVDRDPAGDKPVAQINPFDLSEVASALYMGTNAVCPDKIDYYRAALRTLLLQVFDGQVRHQLVAIQAAIRSRDVDNIKIALKVLNLMAPILTDFVQEDVAKVEDQLIGVLIGARLELQSSADNGTNDFDAQALFEEAQKSLLCLWCVNKPIAFPLNETEGLVRRLDRLANGREAITEEMRNRWTGQALTLTDFIEAGQAVAGLQTLKDEIEKLPDCDPPDPEPAVPVPDKEVYRKKVGLQGTMQESHVIGYCREYSLPCKTPENKPGRIRRVLWEGSIMASAILVSLLKNPARVATLIGAALSGNAFGDLMIAFRLSRVKDDEVMIIYGNADSFTKGMYLAWEMGLVVPNGAKVFLITDVGSGTRSEIVCLAERSSKGEIVEVRTQFRNIALTSTAMLSTSFRNGGAGMFFMLSIDNILNQYMIKGEMANGQLIEETAFGLNAVASRRFVEGFNDRQFGALRDLGQIVVFPDGTICIFVEKPKQFSILRHFLRKVAFEWRRVKVSRPGLGGSAEVYEEAIWERHRQIFTKTINVAVARALGLGEQTEGGLLYLAMFLNETDFRAAALKRKKDADGADITSYYASARAYRESLAADPLWQTAFARVKVSQEEGESAPQVRVCLDKVVPERWVGLVVDTTNSDPKKDTVAQRAELSTMTLEMLQLVTGLQEERQRDKDDEKYYLLGRMPVERVFAIFCRDKYKLQVRAEKSLAEQRGGLSFKAREIDQAATAGAAPEAQSAIYRQMAELNLIMLLGRIAIPMPVLSSHEEIVNINKARKEKIEVARSILEQYCEGAERSLADEEVESMVRIAWAIIYTNVNTFNMALRFEMEPLFRRYSEESRLSKVVKARYPHESQVIPLKGACGEFDWAQRVMEPMMRTREEWMKIFDQTYGPGANERKKIEVYLPTVGKTEKFEAQIEDWVTIWEVAQDIKKLSHRQAINDAGYASFEATRENGGSGIGVAIVDNFSDIGTVYEQAKKALSIFEKDTTVDGMVDHRSALALTNRFDLGLHPNRNFEAGAILGKVTLTDRIIDAMHQAGKEASVLPEYVIARETVAEGKTRVTLNDGVSPLLEFYEETTGEGIKVTVDGQEFLTTIAGVDCEAVYSIKIGGVTIKDIDKVYVGTTSAVPERTIINPEVVLVDFSVERILDYTKEGDLAAEPQIPSFFVGQQSHGETIAFIRQQKRFTRDTGMRFLYGVNWAGGAELQVPQNVAMAGIEVFDGHTSIGLVPISILPTDEGVKGRDPVLRFYDMATSPKKRQDMVVMGLGMRAPHFDKHLALTTPRTVNISMDEEGKVTRTGIAQLPQAQFYREHLLASGLWTREQYIESRKAGG
ncbi:MAG: hypothetical protein WC901_05060 [Candidatus Margulisiibacteriota bacterium]